MTIDGMHQIGEVAEAVGLSLRTIRHWDDVALVPPSGRSAGGFRLYTDADIERLRLGRSLKPLDLTLEEIRDPARAEQRGDGLRERLASVEVLARTLRAEATDHRIPA